MAKLAPFSPDDALQGKDLRGVDLQRRDLSARDLREADLTGADLREASLAGADLTGAHLADCSLVDADLSGAKLSGATLSYADLCGAVLRGAELEGADLSGTNLLGVDLREATITGARLSWVRGLSLPQRHELQRRGARVPASWLAHGWASFSALVRRRAGLAFLVGLALVALVAVAIASWTGQRIRLYRLAAPGAGVVYEVDCGSAADRPFTGLAGHLGGEAGRMKHPTVVKRVALAPHAAYLTERRGAEFGYRFEVERGWYEVQLHFAELHHTRHGRRAFDIFINGHRVERSFDILAEAPPGSALVRSWAVWVDDQRLDLFFRERHDLAKINFLRIRRLDHRPGGARDPGGPPP